MNQKLIICNEFGIKPTTNHRAVGLDFYVPNIPETDESYQKVLPELLQSFKITQETAEKYINAISLATTIEADVLGCEKEDIESNLLNLFHLYAMFNSVIFEDEDSLEYTKYDEDYIEDNIDLFIQDYLTFDKEKHVFGLKLKVLDHVLINSGIRVALPENMAGVFFNKSGRGNKGFDVRAQVVDPDYTGMVHLSLAYTSQLDGDGTFYIGDKITQMCILPYYQVEAIEEVTKESYDNIMDWSERGTDGFGSSDEKH